MRRALSFAVLVVTALSLTHAQAGKRVYISVDLEGISGVNGED
jgi:hypothetical protein